MQKFVRTLLLMALFALPFATQAQTATADRVYLAPEGFSVANPEGWLGGTAAYSASFSPAADVLPSWTYTDQSLNGLPAGHYYFNLFAQNQYRWIITPEVNLAESGEAALQFDMALTPFSAAEDTVPDTALDEGKRVMLLVQTKNTYGSWSNWTTLASWTRESLTDSLLSSIPNTYRTYTYDLEAYLDRTVRFAFYVENTSLRKGSVNIHLDNVSVTGKVKCLPVQGLKTTDIAVDGLTFAWVDTVNPVALQYVARLYKGNSVVDTLKVGSDVVIPASSSRQYSYAFTGLDAAQRYTVQVVAYADANTAADAVTATVMTHYAPVAMPTNYTFEGTDAVADWYFSTNTSNGWFLSAVEDTIGTGHQHALWMSADSGATNAVASNGTTYAYAYFPVSFEAGSYDLTFDWRSTGGYPNGYIRVYLIPEDATVSGYAGSWTQLGNSFYGSADWSEAFLPFDIEEAGNYHLAFYYYGYSAYEQAPAIDNVVLAPRSCYAVDSLTATDVSRLGFTLSWTDAHNEGASYAVRCLRLGDTVPTWRNVQAGNYSVVYDDLEASTAYELTVYTLCGGDTARLSTSTTVETFCPQPSITPAGTYTVTAYASGSYLWTYSYVHVHVYVDGERVDDINSNTTKTYDIPAGTEFRVERYQTSYSSWYGYSDIDLTVTNAAGEELVDGDLESIASGDVVFLVPAVMCTDPQGKLTVSDRTGSSAVLSWVNPLIEDADHYEVSVVANGQTAFEANDLTDLSVELTSLTHSTTYMAYVNAVYADGYVYADSVSFSTLEPCNGPSNVVLTPARVSIDMTWDQDDASISTYDLVVSDSALDATALAAATATAIEIAEGETPHYTIAGLARETQYYIYLRSRCSETLTSLWQSYETATHALVECVGATVAEGTSTNDYVPFYGYYADESQHNQMLYPASMLEDLKGGAIDSIKFYIATAGYFTDTKLGQWTVSLGETEATTLSGLNNTTATTQLFSGYPTFEKEDGTPVAMVIKFSKPYVYNGGNLLIDFSHNAAQWCSMSFYGISASGAAYSYNGQRNFLPKMTLGGCTIFEACPQVTDLAAEADITTATISWTTADADYLDGYQYILQLASADAPAADAVGTAIAKGAVSFVAEGLNESTDYTFYIRTLCSTDNDTSDWTAVSFKTLAQCRVPANIVATVNGKNSAVAVWENTGRAIEQSDNFEYILDTVALSADSLANYAGTILTVDDTTMDLTDLAYETTYYLYVRAACGTELHSEWVAANGTFTTGKKMPAVINLAADANHSTMNVSWESDTANYADETEWMIAYRTIDDSTDLVWNAIDHTDTLILGLYNDTTYRVYVKAVSGADESAVDSITVNTAALSGNCISIGNENSNSTSSYAPICTYYNYSISESIVEAGKIGARKLTGINYRRLTSSPATRDIAVYLMPTTKTSFTSNTDFVSVDATAVKVYDDSYTFTGGWNSITFTAPYEFDGTSNLMVVFVDKTGSYTSSSTSYYVDNSASANMTIYYYRDNCSYCDGGSELDPANIVTGGGTAGSITGTPVMQFCYERTNSCFEPNDLAVSNITTTSADVNWLPGNVETEWQYVYSTEELNAETLAAATINTTAAVSVSLADLDRNADYNFYVRGICGEGDTSDWSTISFATAYDCAVPVKLGSKDATTNSITLVASAGAKGEPESMTFAYWKRGTTERTEVVANLVEDIDSTFAGLSVDSTLVEDSMVYTYDSTYTYDTARYYAAEVEGLDATSLYAFVAASNCGTEDGISRWSDSAVFNTLCDGFVTLPYEEGFENNSITAGCWTVIANDTMNNNSIVTNGCIYPASGLTQGAYDRYVISPEFESTDSVYWQAYVYTTQYSYYGGNTNYGTVAFGYSTTDNDTASFIWMDTANYTGTWVNHFVPAGTKYVAFHFYGPSVYNCYVGDANIRELKTFNVVAATADAELGKVIIIKDDTDTLPEAESYNETIYEMTRVEIAAVANEGHHLTCWTYGANGDTIFSSGTTPYTQTNIIFTSLAKDTNLTAHFEIDPYVLHVRENNSNYGYAKIMVDADTVIRDTNDYYGTAITVQAFDTVESDNYIFRGWSKSNNANSIVSYENPYSFTMDGNYTLTAMFVIDSFNVAVNINDTSMGITTGQGNYALGTSNIHLTATPKYGYEFVKWTGADGFDTIAAAFDTAANNTPMVFNAQFQKIPFYMQLTSNDPTKGTATADVYEGLYLTPMVLTATATAEHYHFQYWSDGTTENPYNFLLTQDTNMIAFFAIDTHKVEIAAREDMGAVAINGEDTNLMWFDYGTQAVEIEAIPNTGVQFVKWMEGDEEVSTLNPYTFETIEADRVLTAVFDSIVYDVTVNINEIEGSIVDVADQTVVNGYYGDTMTFVLEGANPGFRFTNWSDAEENVYAGDTLVYVVNANVEQWIRANFVEAGKINVNMAVNIADGGTAVVYGTRTVEGIPVDTNSLYGNNRFDSLSTIALVATPADHYHFIGWTVNENELSANLNDTIENIGGDSIVTLNIVANFEIDTHFVTAVAENGSFKFNGAAADTIYADYGTQVNINAIAADHYHFLAWENGNTNADTTVTVDGDIELNATFELDTNVVIFAVNNALFGTVTPTGYKSLEGADSAWYFFGDTATLTAAANTGYHFVKWSNDESNATYEFPVYGTLQYTATFDTNVYNVVATVAGDADNMGTINGPATVKHFTSNNYVAVANTGYHFVNWTNAEGTVLGTDDTLALVNPVSDTAITANFDFNAYNVSAAVAEGCEEMGTVGGDTTANYQSTVKLYATAAEGYHLVKWSNNATTDTITVTVPAEDVTYTATFAINTYNVTASVNNAAMGSVTGAKTTEHGAVDTLVAVANYGYHFTGWDNEVETDTMALTVVSDTAVVANFAKNQYTATVEVNDATMGTALRSNGTPEYLDSVTFTASANQHYRFVNWSNGDTNSTITIQITKDTTMKANFEAIMFTVHSSVNDATMGTVTPAGDSTVLEGQQITYVATANEGYQFKNWSTGETTATITVTVNGNMNIVANFEAIPINYYSITVSAASASMGTVTGSNNHVAEGDTVTVTATAANGYRFTGWMEGNSIVSDENPYTFVVTGNRTLVAQFVAVYTVTAQANDNTMGTVTPVNAQYDEGQTALVEAQANANYHFVAWVNANNTNDTISRNARYEFTVNANVDLIAVFAANVGIDDVDMENVIIYSAETKIFVRGAENRSIYIFDVNGRMVASEANATETAEFRMGSTGVYLVKVGNAPAKRVLVVR